MNVFVVEPGLSYKPVCRRRRPSKGNSASWPVGRRRRRDRVKIMAVLVNWSVCLSVCLAGSCWDEAMRYQFSIYLLLLPRERWINWLTDWLAVWLGSLFYFALEFCSTSRDFLYSLGNGRVFLYQMKSIYIFLLTENVWAYVYSPC